MTIMLNRAGLCRLLWEPRTLSQIFTTEHGTTATAVHNRTGDTYTNVMGILTNAVRSHNCYPIYVKLGYIMFFISRFFISKNLINFETFISFLIFYVCRRRIISIALLIYISLINIWSGHL